MSSARRVVLSGVGVLSSIGLTADSFWNALKAGQSGIRTIQSFDPGSLSTRFVGEISAFDPKKYIAKDNRKSLRVMARAIQLAVCAAQLALDDGKVDMSKLDRTRFGVEFGAGLMPSELVELAPAALTSSNCKPGRVDMKRWGEQGLEAVPPLWMLKYLPNMPACHISIMHDAQGPNNSITESDIAGLLALGEAGRILRRGQADFFLVGGSDSKTNALSMVRQCLFGHLSRRNETPETACRPFDKSRDGLVIGEGSGVLVVEDLEHANKRGARIYSELVGFGAAFDHDHSGSGIARAMKAALAQAGLTPADIDHVNAHGLGSPRFDPIEAHAIKQVFGTQPVPVWSLKGAIGHTGAGSGPLELVGSILAMMHRELPATINHHETDPNCPIQVNRTAITTRTPYFLKIGFTEMGQSAAVICKRWEL